MVAVRINGEESQIRAESLGSIADIVELIKTQIDPEHMITNLLLNGSELRDADWNAPTAQYETVIIEAETGTPQEFVTSRFASSSEIVRTIFNQFRDARKSFQSGDMMRGNQQLVEAVGTAKAFFEWYSSILALVPENQKSEYDIGENVEGIAVICKQLCQQQLYQSWWALGETIKCELEPKLDELEDRCRKFAV